MAARKNSLEARKSLMVKNLIEARNTNVVPVVLTRSEGPTQEEMDGNKK